MHKSRRIPRNTCWAQGYDCSGEIEKEHVISDGLLKEFGPITLNVGPQKFNLGSGSFITTSLCAKHNRELSEFDSEAIKFFRTWRDVVQGPLTSKKYQFDGSKIEKWFAKTLVNSTLFRHQAFRDYTSPPILLSFEKIKRVLFGGEEFSAPYGLYTKWPDTEKVFMERNWMNIQIKDMYWIKKSTGMCYSCEIPWSFAAGFFGVNLVAFFNMSPYSDAEAIKSMPVYREVLNFLENHKYRNFYLASGGSVLEQANKIELIF